MKGLTQIINILLLVLTINLQLANAEDKKDQILIFVSFSMNDSALQKYFKEASLVGAKLVIRGLINNSFMATRQKMQQLKINIEIDPNKFEEYRIKRVPAIVVVSDQIIKKITGHLPLASALEIMEKDQ